MVCILLIKDVPITVFTNLFDWLTSCFLICRLLCLLKWMWVHICTYIEKKYIFFIISKHFENVLSTYLQKYVIVTVSFIIWKSGKLYNACNGNFSFYELKLGNKKKNSYTLAVFASHPLYKFLLLHLHIF